jgi:hypothetical protein
MGREDREEDLNNNESRAEKGDEREGIGWDEGDEVEHGE